MKDGRSHLGLVVYCWGLQEQSHLIVDCLAPAALELRRSGLSFFWFDRFDARGPHVFALFGVPPDQIPAAQDLLARRVADHLDHLALHPSREDVTEADLLARHQACRGTAFCAIDARAGFGARNTFDFCPHPVDTHGYPFRLGRFVRQPERLWELMDDLAAWVTGELARSPDRTPTTAAVRWLASFAHALLRRDFRADEYWWYHASTMIRLRPGAGGPEALDDITRAVGARNEATFTRVWEEVAAEPPSWPLLPQMIDLALETGEPEKIHPLLREISHLTLRQMGLIAKLEVPLLLFAWKHSLTARMQAKEARPD